MTFTGKLRRRAPPWPCAMAMVSALLLWPHGELHAQARETVLGGVVLDDLSMEPIASATVSIVGSDRTTLTDEYGAFAYTDPPLGKISLRVVSADRLSMVQEVEVHAESITHVQFFLPPMDAVVSELLVRGRAEAEPVEPTTAVDLLSRQVLGLLGGASMAGEVDRSIVLRGLGTFGDNIEPILFVDGIRVSGAGVYDALRQIPAADVETIEVLRGAAGAFLHPDGANGVIHVHTKVGLARESN
jgi:hypothetical protein